MQLTVQLPDEVAAQLGPDAQKSVLEAVVADAYREGRLTDGQVARALGLTRWQAEEFLDKHGARASYTLEMLQEDRRTLGRLRQG